MRRQYYFYILFPIILLFLIVNSGCGTTKSVVNRMKGEKPYLKKKIMVFPPINHSGLPSRGTQITESLVGLLKESPHLLFYPPPEALTLPSEAKNNTNTFGVAYYCHPDLVKMAKERDMNALIAAYMPPIETIQGRGGTWPFRYAAEIFKISMITNVMDVTNGCLYLSEFDSEEVALASDKVKALDGKEALDQAWTKALPDILERQTSAVVKSLVEKPWTGRILEVSKDGLKINAGKDVGVCLDQLFFVYEQGESITCRTGSSIDLLGKKVGEIKTTSVMEQHSLAAPETGGPFFTGQTIVFMPD